MLETTNAIELIKLLLPLILLQFGLALYCVTLIWRKGVRNLNKPIWTGIVLLVNMIGPVAYLLVGRKRLTNDQD